MKKTNDIWEKIRRAAQAKDLEVPGAEEELRRLIEKLRKQNMTPNVR
jgi:hypothetical protein